MLGLSNQGNTCWLNSLIQGFSTLDNFENHLLLYKDKPLHGLVYNIIKLLKEGDSSNIEEKNRVDEYMSYLIKIILNKYKHRDSNSGYMIPHDSEEGWMILIDILHEEIQMPIDKNIKTLEKYKQLLLYNSWTYSKIISLFYGQKYWKCNDGEERYEPYTIIYLDRIDNTDVVVDELLKEYFLKNQIISIPKILSISIVSPIRRCQCNISLEFGIQVTNKVNRFLCKSIIIHNGGHYYSFIKRDNDWYIVDDSNVIPIDKDIKKLSIIPRLIVYELIE